MQKSININVHCVKIAIKKLQFVINLVEINEVHKQKFA